MRIVQSFWSKPSSNDQSTGSNLRNSGGWPELRYFYYAWALSSLKFSEFFKDLTLFTDKEGKYILVDQLKLPYTKVFVELDQLNTYSPKLWAIGKLYTYSRQTTPFIHADGDFIPFRKFSKQFLQANLLVQSKETGLEKFYLPILNSVKSRFRDIPEEIRNPVTREAESANLGIVGGHYIDFFRNYSKTAFDFIDKNVDRLDTVQVGEFNCIAEQYLFYQMAMKRNLDVKFLLSSVSPSRRQYFYSATKCGVFWSAFPQNERNFDFSKLKLLYEIDLQQGDILYLPREFVHDVTTTDRASAHISFGGQHFTWATIVNSLVT